MEKGLKDYNYKLKIDYVKIIPLIYYKKRPDKYNI